MDGTQINMSVWPKLTELTSMVLLFFPVIFDPGPKGTKGDKGSQGVLGLPNQHEVVRPVSSANLCKETCLYTYVMEYPPRFCLVELYIQFYPKSYVAGTLY